MLDKIKEDINVALKAGDKDKVETLKMISSALKYAEIDSGGELSDEASIKVLQKEAKKRKEAAEMYAKAGESQREAKEKSEVTLIEEYLPQMMSEDEINKLIDEVLAEFDGNPPHNGAVIQGVIKKAAGQADGGTVAQLVNKKLNS